MARCSIKPIHLFIMFIFVISILYTYQKSIWPANIDGDKLKGTLKLIKIS